MENTYIFPLTLSNKLLRTLEGVGNQQQPSSSSSSLPQAAACASLGPFNPLC